MITKLLDKTFWKFILVGIINTLFGTTIMFIFYNIFHFGYWFSSASNYVLGSILSYFLNKNFTFKNKSRDIKVVLRFILNIIACYIVAYGLAKPLVKMILNGFSSTVQENIAMLSGMCLFVLLNYIGQRFFTFKNNEN